jgi:hypothetical protein
MTLKTDAKMDANMDANMDAKMDGLCLCQIHEATTPNSD